MISLTPTNNATALEVTKKRFGGAKIVADFGAKGKVEVTVSAKVVREYLSLKPDCRFDPNDQLRRIGKRDGDETFLYFAPVNGADLVVVKTSEFTAALS